MADSTETETQAAAFQTGQGVRVVRLLDKPYTTETRAEYLQPRQLGAVGEINGRVLQWRDGDRDRGWYVKHETGDPNDIVIAAYDAEELEPYTPPAPDPRDLAVARAAAELGMNHWRAMKRQQEVWRAYQAAEKLYAALSNFDANDEVWTHGDARDDVLEFLQTMSGHLSNIGAQEQQAESRAWRWLYMVADGKRLPPLPEAAPEAPQAQEGNADASPLE